MTHKTASKQYKMKMDTKKDYKGMQNDLKKRHKLTKKNLLNNYKITKTGQKQQNYNKQPQRDTK